MSHPLNDQIESFAALIAALQPGTGTDPFERVPGDLPVEQEPPTRHRSFLVQFDESPPLTGVWFGTSHRTVVGRFLVTVLYDARHAQRTLSQQLVEDSDQIVSLCESPASRASSDVLQIRLVDRTITRDPSGDFLTLTLVFTCEYRVAL